MRSAKPKAFAIETFYPQRSQKLLLLGHFMLSKAKSICFYIRNQLNKKINNQYLISISTKQVFMIKINKVLYNTRIAEFYNLIEKINRVCKASGLGESDPLFLKVIKEIEAQLPKWLLAIKKEVASSDLDEHDTIRDDVFRSIVYITKGYTHHPDKVVKAAALLVDDVIERYGLKINNATYAEESTLLDSFMKDIATEAIGAQLELLPGLPDLVKDLKRAQSDFKKADEQYFNARSESKDIANATACKKEMLKLINGKLIVYLRAMVAVGNENYNDCASKVADLIIASNTTAKSRTE